MANRCSDAKDSQEHEIYKRERDLARCLLNTYISLGSAIRLGFVREFKRIVYADLSVNIVV